jgi:hypothetical protein
MVLHGLPTSGIGTSPTNSMSATAAAIGAAADMRFAGVEWRTLSDMRGLFAWCEAQFSSAMWLSVLWPTGRKPVRWRDFVTFVGGAAHSCFTVQVAAERLVQRPD